MQFALEEKKDAKMNVKNMILTLEALLSVLKPDKKIDS